MVRALLVAAVVLSSCTGRVATVEPHQDGDPPRVDRGGVTGDGPVLPPDAGKADVLPHAGDPCPFAECTPDALCLGGICLRICSQPCNEPTDECAAGEACYQATTFSSACFPGATADTGEGCGAEARCLPKNLCVRVNNDPARCFLLCKYGCNGSCYKADNGCEFCVP